MFDPNKIQSAKLKCLHAYWEAKRHDKLMPSRADVDPMDIPWVLGSLSLIDVRGDGDYFWRLDGTKLVEFFGCDMTGRSISEYPYPAYIEILRTRFDDAVRVKGPSVAVRRFSADSHRWNYETLFLPLSSDDMRVEILMQAIEIDRR